jgi:hypothetical protein
MQPDALVCEGLISEAEAVEAAWFYFLREEMDVPFAGVVKFVRSNTKSH